MKTVTILCERLGETCYTPSTPRREWTAELAQRVDLDETKVALTSSDDWRPVRVKRWELAQVTLPDWLSAEEYCADHIAWDRAVGFGAPYPREWPEAWLRYLVTEREDRRNTAAVLLGTGKFRSAFRQSLHDQLVTWLETAPDARRYDSPFSARQWESLTRNWRPWRPQY